MGTSHFSGWMDELGVEPVTLESLQRTFLKPIYLFSAKFHVSAFFGMTSVLLATMDFTH